MPTRVKEDVIVFDGTGRHAAVSCALHLAEHGRSVQFVTLDDNIALEMEYSSRVVYRQRFAKNGVKTTVDQQLVERREARQPAWSPRFRHELTGADDGARRRRRWSSRTAPCRSTTCSPACAAARSIAASPTSTGCSRASRSSMPRPRAGAFELHRIGDAVTSRGVHSAIYDALRLASAL